MEISTITAPELLKNGVEKISKLLSQKSVEDFPLLIQEYSQIVLDSFKYDEKDEFFRSTPASEEFRKEFFKELVTLSNERLIAELKAKGISNILFVTPTGMQGAGKGTNGDTNSEVAKLLIAPESDNSIDFYDPRGTSKAKKISDFNTITKQKDQVAYSANVFARALDVKTGTGGIFLHANTLAECSTPEEKEYFELFNKLKEAMGATNGTFIESNIVAISLNLFLANKVRQAPSGISTFNIDLYPRSSEQSVLLKEFQEQLQDKGIANSHKVIDYKILSEEDVNFLRSHKERVTKLAKKLKPKFSRLYSETAKAYSVDSYKLNFEVLKGIINDFFADHNLSEDFDPANPEIDIKIVQTMLAETLIAVERAKGRYEQGREDDAPLLLLKRISDYFTKSYVSAFEASEDSLIMLSTLGDPIDVAQRTFCTLYGLNPDSSEIKPNGRYFSFLENYKALVARKVKGKFEYQKNYRRFIRGNKHKILGNFNEIVHWNSDFTSVLYTIQAQDGTEITLRITDHGIQWFDGRNSKQREETWRKLKSLGATKNWSYNIKDLKTFKENFRELSVAV